MGKDLYFVCNLWTTTTTTTSSDWLFVSKNNYEPTQNALPVRRFRPRLNYSVFGNRCKNVPRAHRPPSRCSTHAGPVGGSNEPYMSKYGLQNSHKLSWLQQHSSSHSRHNRCRSKTLHSEARFRIAPVSCRFSANGQPKTELKLWLFNPKTLQCLQSHCFGHNFTVWFCLTVPRFQVASVCSGWHLQPDGSDAQLAASRRTAGEHLAANEPSISLGSRQRPKTAKS